ncbi:hypothetical protein ElyMa_005216200 [Elysia marginata]|uniref:Uncharacterized protein n=1 Tax=Elysia marginata TaxID=1093978 RepID=A0AAV4JWX9_9GAST|nr:hypothetical protein ElyMa_005216200 [Elysia marginata]
MERYILCWPEHHEEILEPEYERAQNHATDGELLESLQQSRKERWTETDFTHSSRHAWQTMKKLDPDSRPTKSSLLISPDKIAEEIKEREKHTPNQSFEKHIRKESSSLFLGAPMTRKEMEKAIKCTKNGKAADNCKYLEGCANKIAKRHRPEKARKNNMGRLTICSAIVNWLMLNCMNEQMDKGKPLPAKALRVKEEDFRRFEPDPDKKQPVPKASTKQYGWNIGVGKNRLEYLDSLTRPAPRVHINSQLGWPWGAQD